MSIRRYGVVRPACAAALALALLGAALAGCGNDEPVGRVVAEPAAVRLAYPQPVPVRLTWTPLAPVEPETGQLLVFVHLLGGTEGTKQIVRTFDHPFPQAWTPGKPVSYTLDLGQSALAPPIPPGRYRLSLGLYDGARERWPLDGPPEVVRREYKLADVEVPAAEAPAPAFQFATGWKPPERTGDNQLLMRRWVDGPSTIAVANVPAAGAVHLVLRLPEVQQQAGERLLLDPGFERPTVSVSSTCDGSQAALDGFGPHAVDVRVAAGGGCEITVAPHFNVARVDTVAPRSPAFLEELLWKPGPPAPAR